MSTSKYNPQKHHRRSIRLKGYDYAQEGLYFITICCQNRMHRFGEIIDGEMKLNDNGEIAHRVWQELPQRFKHIEIDVFQIMPNHVHGIICIGNSVGTSIADCQNINTGNDNKADDNWAEASPARTDAQDANAENNIGAGVNPARTDCQNINIGNDKWAEASPAPTDWDKWADDNWAGVNPARTGNTIGDIVGAYKSLVANGCLNLYKSKNEMMGKLWQRNYWEHIIRTDSSYHRIADYIISNPITWDEDSLNN
jgi:putative transposase